MGLGNGGPDPDYDPDAPPNPGSATAQWLGCTCAVLDNNHGNCLLYTSDAADE